MASSRLIFVTYILYLIPFIGQTQPWRDEYNISLYSFEFKHPITVIIHTELLGVKENIQNNIEPQISVYQDLISEADEKLGITPDAPDSIDIMVGYEPNSNLGEMRDWLWRNSHAAYTCGLAYTLTGDKRYAHKALEFALYAGYNYWPSSPNKTTKRRNCYKRAINLTSNKDHDRKKLSGFSMDQNYPNPFSPITRISFSLPARDHIRFRIYNSTGQRVELLVNRVMEAGTHNITFNASDLPLAFISVSFNPEVSQRLKKLFTMNNQKIIRTILVTGALLIGMMVPGQAQENKSLKNECLQTMQVLNKALLNLQINDETDVNHGALKCPNCKVLHTRAAEAVFPFAMTYLETGYKKYLQASINLGNWLIRQQYPGGEWQETPEDWTGTTTDQLLMMAQAFLVIGDQLADEEKESWKESIRKSADYLTLVMSPEFASINYCATTTASLMVANQIVPDEKYVKKAKSLAHEVIAKIDEDYFLFGEGGRVYGIKYGVDLGYNLEMSLWGLSLYSRLAADTLVENIVRKSLKVHLNFIYPDGSMDGSWGIRSNKWTTYGGATSDGCQVLFGMHAQENNAYGTAALRNLEYLRGMIRDGLVGYGPHYWLLYDQEPCIYPTFAKAKNLAMTLQYATRDDITDEKLPSDEIGATNYFETVGVVTKRTENFMATISPGYEAEKNWRCR
jgi:hypothetical protein